MKILLSLLMIFALVPLTFGQVICLDPGHGGSDPGAVGHGRHEADINLSVCNKLKTLLQRAGYTVRMTRTSDSYVSLSGRTSYANSIGADRFISIHCNAFNKSANGTETFCYTRGSSNSYRLRDAVHPGLVAALGTTDRGTKTANFYVIKHTNMPAILCELAFIDHSGDSAKLGSNWYQDRCAQKIMEGLQNSLAMMETESFSEGYYIAPKWSPDGTKLMVSGPGYNGLHVLSLDGQVKSITNEKRAGYQANWVSEMEIQSSTMTADIYGNTVPGIRAASVCQLVDGALQANGKEIAKIANDEIFHFQVSPDSKKVVFETLSSGIFVVNIDGSEKISLGSGHNPSWSADSKSLVFDYSKDDGHRITVSNLVLVHLNSSENRVMLTNVQPVAEHSHGDEAAIGHHEEAQPFLAQRPSLSPDGSKIAFDIEGQIYVANLVNNKLENVQLVK